MHRRPFLAALPLVLAGADRPSAAALAPANPVAPALGVSHRPLVFPADHGAHPDTRIEWWYVTGWLAPASATAQVRQPAFGFQVTFFRSRTDLAAQSASRFAARQLVFAHVALTDLGAGPGDGRLLHDQRLAREGLGLASTPTAEGAQTVQLLDWSLRRDAGADSSARSALHIAVRSERFAFTLELAGTQPVLLQGEEGYSQKGPQPRQASHYYSEPQLAVQGRLQRAGAVPQVVDGRAWLDHEWSNELLPAEAVGWDWVGFNLSDGAALMAFRLRRADGSGLWAGGSYRDTAGALRVFAPSEVHFETLRRWRSPRTEATYPVECVLTTPAGRWHVVALQDDQELDSRESTGSVYWEGLCALRGDSGAVAGYGYLELTGYASPLRL